MPSEKRFFDDVARVAGGALGAVAGIRQEIESRLREQLERWLSSMDLVSREEFEAAKAMAAKARAEQERLEIRLAALEASLAEKDPALAKAAQARAAHPAEPADFASGTAANKG